ncbi:hypothetical protein LARI1_G007590 [Lachnellula arida]|uniref:HTH CENPB-type domain-containing protein n=1 Tax=Lachnellula arida TaxID=1316785 RepID=A0A8T9B656_9HELO|nr:hypothetical protein LARI1_G007590 [Lachnellula arida]
MSDRASKALAEAFLPGEPRTYDATSKRSGVSLTTLYHRQHGRRSNEEKSQSQQYLTPSEEIALEKYLKLMADLGNPVRIKFIPSLALSIARQRSMANEPLKPPGKNWAQSFQKRHPALKSRRFRAMDWKRHENNIYNKIIYWFEVIEQVLKNPAIVPGNVYNMDETGVMLCKLSSVKVLVGKDDPRDYRGAGVRRTMVTAIECISASGRSLLPMIIWPASTHRSNWTTFHTPGWHYACSDSGYTDSKISLEWLKRVFHPQSVAEANQKPRVLPCDVGVFAPLKAAYRDEVDRLFRGGANTIGKEHFTSLYSPARERAFSKRNITAAWAASGLFPFNPDRVLRVTPKPLGQSTVLRAADESELGSCYEDERPQTPITPVSAEALVSLHNLIKQDAYTLDGNETSTQRLQRHIQKLATAAQISFADRALLRDQNQMLTRMNDEAKVRRKTKSVVLGKARVMSYEDIVVARAARAAKDAIKGKGKRGRKRNSTALEEDEPEAGAETDAEPEVVSQVIKGKGKRGRKRKSAALQAEGPEATEANAGTEPEMAWMIEAPGPWRAPVARMI